MTVTGYIKSQVTWADPHHTTMTCVFCRPTSQSDVEVATNIRSALISITTQRRSVGNYYRRPRLTAILPPPKVVRSLIIPIFCCPPLIAARDGPPLLPLPPSLRQNDLGSFRMEFSTCCLMQDVAMFTTTASVEVIHACSAGSGSSSILHLVRLSN